MNAFSTIDAPETNNKQQNALDAWNQMRGRMVEIFARIELAVTATLHCLAQIEGRGEAVVVNPILNRRFSQLTDLLSSQGPFSNEGKKITNPLKAMGDQIPFRNFLCHGHSSLYIDESGRWIVQLQMPSVLQGQAEMNEILLTADGAKQKMTDLHREAARLTNQLKQLCERISVQRSL
jgi:hypothetical protein